MNIEDSQARNHQLTINNPAEYGLSHDVIIERILLKNPKYLCMADEIGENGTFHTHIYVQWRSSMRFSTISKLLNNKAHIENAYGSPYENRDYILKSGKWANSAKSETSVEGSFFEYGTIQESSSGSYAKQQLLEDIRNGMTTNEIIRAHPNFAFNVSDIDTLRERFLSEKFTCENRNIECVEYIYGPTAVGKTYSLYAKHSPSEICRITNYSNPMRFDSYNGQDVICFDEFRSQISISDMLSYLDIYPLFLPARYSDRVACYTHIYILSNWDLNEQYKSVQLHDRKTWHAFLRRISSIKHYYELGKYTEFSPTDKEANIEY